MTPSTDLTESIAEAVHEGWMATKRSQGVESRRSESGEELMVPYADLSEGAKELDRGTVRAVLGAVTALGYEVRRPDPTDALTAAAEVVAGVASVKVYVDRGGVGTEKGCPLDKALRTIQAAEEVRWVDPDPGCEFTLLARSGNVTAIFDVRPRPLAGAA